MTQPASPLEPIRAFFQKLAERKHVPGLAYGVIVDGELVAAETLGVANVATQAAVTPDSIFRIASMTKSFAAAAILRLRDDGLLALDNAAADYVHELAAWTYPTADAVPVTVRQLLNMAAGFPEDNPWGDRQLHRTDAEMDVFYEAGMPWSTAPGTVFEYSNYAYMLLGRIVTNVAAMPFIDYVNRHFLQPLGMHSTFWQAEDVPPDRLALGYRWEDEQWKDEPMLPSGGDVAAFAGIFTSLNDLARWVAFFLDAFPPRDDEDNAPLRRSSRREMQQIGRTHAPSVTPNGLGKPPLMMAGGYGFGLAILENPTWHSVGHGGGLPGFGSYMCWAPNHRVGVIGLANVTYAGIGAACRQALATLVQSGGYKPTPVTPSSALVAARAEVIALLNQWDDERAAVLFADNFFLDMDREHWLKELADLRTKHGALTPSAEFKVENWLRGTWRMTGDRGWCDLFISLTPTVPPRVQALEIESTLPPSSALQAAADALAALTANPTRQGLRRLCAKEADFDAVWDQVRLANILCGSCAIGEVTGGDGKKWAGFRFTGPKGQADVTLRVNARGKSTEIVFQPVL